MDMEKFDVLDCAGRKTGGVIDRDEAHASGIWHGAFHCLIVFLRDGKGHALFQLRSHSKKIAANKLDVSVGGHYAAGEGAREAGPREIREELGITVRFEDLFYLGRRIFVYCFSPGIREYEFQDIFLLQYETIPDRLVMQESEVAGVVEVDINDGIKLLTGKNTSISCRFTTASGISGQRQITRSDFVPCLDDYYLKLLVLSKRWFSGERELLVI